MELGHLLTRSGLTYPEVSSKVYHDSFCQSDSTISLPWVIYFEAFYLHVLSFFCCVPVICPKLVLFLTPLQFVHLFCNLSQVYPAVLLMCFISVAVILLPSLALTVQVSLPHNKTGRASVLCSLFRLYIPRYHVPTVMTANLTVKDNIETAVGLLFHSTTILHIPTSQSISFQCSYLLTPCCRVLLEQLTGLQLVKKFPAFHGT